MKLCQAERRLQGGIAQREIGRVLAGAGLMQAETGYQADRQSVHQTVLDVGLRAEIVRRPCAVQRSVTVELAIRHVVVDIRLDQPMTLRQGRSVGCEQRAGPPGLVHALLWRCAALRGCAGHRGRADADRANRGVERQATESSCDCRACNQRLHGAAYLSIPIRRRRFEACRTVPDSVGAASIITPPRTGS